MLGKLARDPLAHFLVAGGLLFALLAWHGDDADPESRTITVTDEVQASLALQFENVLRRAPTDAELEGLVQNWVREEVLYREALRLGLDADDAVIRKRLASKMEQLAGAQAEVEAPSTQVLGEWLRSHPERFAEGVSVTFRQATFANDDARRAALQSDASEAGAPTALPARLENATHADVANRFGSSFADALLSLPEGGPAQIESSFGFHLVWVEERKDGRIPPLSEVKGRVEADWRSSTIAARREQAFDLLREAYTVDIE